MASQRPSKGDFDFLTAKQAAVLDQLANNRTSKEIAYALGVSETAINRRIEVLRQRLGGVTRHELARRYRQWAAANDHSAQQPSDLNADICVETDIQNLQLARMPAGAAPTERDEGNRKSAFEDPVAMSIEAPWKSASELRIVPRVLDGDNATLTRGATIAVLVFAILASVIVAIAAAKALADAVG